MEFFLEPVDGIAHHVGRDEVAQVIVDDGLGLDVIALGQFFQIEFLGSPVDDIIGTAAEGQEGPAAEAVHMRIGIHGGELHLYETVGPRLFDVQGCPEAAVDSSTQPEPFMTTAVLNSREKAHSP